MDILFFSINIIGCIVYFLFSMKSHHKKSHKDELIYDETTLQKIDNRLSKIEKQIEYK
jgi:hypothetical protein